MTAVPGSTDALLIDKAQKNTVTSHIALDETVTAPVSRGQRLGTLTIQSGQQTLAQIPLVAGAAVERLTWGELFLQVLRKMAMVA